MERWVIVTTVIMLAVVVATAAGFVAARALMHAADAGNPPRGRFK